MRKSAARVFKRQNVGANGEGSIRHFALAEKIALGAVSFREQRFAVAERSVICILRADDSRGQNAETRVSHYKCFHIYVFPFCRAAARFFGLYVNILPLSGHKVNKDENKKHIFN